MVEKSCFLCQNIPAYLEKMPFFRKQIITISASNIPKCISRIEGLKCLRGKLLTTNYKHPDTSTFANNESFPEKDVELRLRSDSCYWREKKRKEGSGGPLYVCTALHKYGLWTNVVCVHNSVGQSVPLSTIGCTAPIIGGGNVIGCAHAVCKGVSAFTHSGNNKYGAAIQTGSYSRATLL